MRIFQELKGEPLNMGRAIGHEYGQIESIANLASHPEHLVYLRKRDEIKSLSKRLDKKGFKLFAISTGDATLNQILDGAESANDEFKIFEYPKLSKEFLPVKAYAIFKNHEVKAHSPGSSHGSPLRASYCGHYAA